MRRLRALPWRKILLLGPLSVFLLLVVAFLVTYALTDIPQASAVSQAQSTVVRYAGGEEMARLGTNRVQVPLSQVSPGAQKAVLAAEDRGFYSEPGISPKGIARALFTNVKGGDVQQGGSTITQQYAKNVYLTSERTYSRKIKEVFIALKMTRERSKDQILWRDWETLAGGDWWFWGIGVVTALFTAFYMFRMVMKTFFGAPRTEAAKSAPESGPAMLIPIGLLAVASLAVLAPERP